MRTSARSIAIAFAVGACFAPLGAHAFDSGSTGVDGILAPTVTTPVDLPESGILNYQSINIPQGVTVTFRRNTTNTPVVLLVSGSVTIAGTINLNGADAVAAGAAGGGGLGDDGQPGVGGPGGFSGGRGGAVGPFATTVAQQSTVTATLGGSGLGPGGGGAGGPSNTHCFGTRVLGGAGGGFFAIGANSGGIGDTTCGGYNLNGFGGNSYGSTSLLPLVGGSGGGGGSGGTSFVGAGGGGGGGSLLIAASGTINVTATGVVTASGGRGGDSQGAGMGAPGGGGSGGGIRMVATILTGNGAINAVGGAAGSDLGSSGYSVNGAGAGSTGRIKLEADTFQRTAATNPPLPAGVPVTPLPVFVAGTPTLRITSVAGVPAPATPTGTADIVLPASTPSQVQVSFETTGVPVGNIVQLTVVPASNAAKVVAVTPALTGTTTTATASVNVSLPSGPSTLVAQTTYTVVAAVGDLLQNFAGNERVEKVTLMATLGGPSMARLTTVSGKEYEVPADVLRIAALGG